MSRTKGTAFDAASKDAWSIVKSIREALLLAIRYGEVTDESELQERKHQEIDDALVYTADQWVCAFGLRQERDPFSEGFLETPESIEQVIGVQAYLNIDDAIDLGDREFSDAFQVREDSELEKEGA